MPRRLTIVLVVLLGLGLVAGCGGGDKKSDSNSASAKADYEKRFVDALRPAQRFGAVGNRINSRSSPESAAKVFDQVSTIYGQAHSGVKAIKPPKDITSLHNQIGAVLARMSTDAGNVRDAIRKKDKFAQTVALADFKAQGSKLQSLAQQLTRKGY